MYFILRHSKFEIRHSTVLRLAFYLCVVLYEVVAVLKTFQPVGLLAGDVKPAKLTLRHPEIGSQLFRNSETLR